MKIQLNLFDVTQMLQCFSVCGHDTAEDAEACMELMLWKAKEDGKLKK